MNDLQLLLSGLSIGLAIVLGIAVFLSRHEARVNKRRREHHEAGVRGDVVIVPRRDA